MMVALTARLLVAVMSAAPMPPAGKGPVVMVLEGQRTEFAHGAAKVGADGLTVTLSSVDTGCDRPPAPGSVWVRFTIPAGPALDFYAGRPIGVDVKLEGQSLDNYAGLDKGNVALQVSAFKAVKGAHVLGSLQFSPLPHDGKKDQANHGSGGFDVEVCEVASGFASLREPPKAGKFIEGTLRGAPQKIGSVLAVTHGNEVWLQLYEKPELECAVVEGHTELVRVRVGGATKSLGFSGQPQPAKAFGDYEEVDAAGKSHRYQDGYHTNSFVRFDRLSFTQGEKVTGTLWLQGPGATPSTALGGAFSAKVCNQFQ